jgi:hypothetical protein
MTTYIVACKQCGRSTSQPPQRSALVRGACVGAAALRLSSRVAAALRSSPDLPRRMRLLCPRTRF